MTSRGQHLTESEFVDLFDDTLAPVRREHVESCAACAAQAADLAMSAQGVEQADVPEPPPFFWTQFSARVGEAVSNEAVRPRIGRSWWAFAAAAGIAVVALAVVSLRNSPEDASVAAPVAVTRTAGVDTGADALADDTSDFESDEAWALVRALAEDLDDEQMNDEGVSAGSGAAERMTSHLTEAERVELARLLKEELRLAGVSESAS
jgi:hypothetical protein